MPPPSAPKLIKRKPIQLAPVERPFVDALQTYGSGLPQDEDIDLLDRLEA